MEISQVYVAGLALDYCVKFTALDVMKKLEIPTTVLIDATRAVDPKTGVEAMGELKDAGIKFMNSTDFPHTT
jgi:nicotinamidase/pyrazinamidase